MPEIITFDQAIEITKERDRLLLLANGFSIQHFTYRNLLERSALPNEDPLRKLFEALQSVDFERAIRILEDAALVENVYGHADQAEAFDADAVRLREALVHAIRDIHPAHREDIEGAIPTCIKFLNHFSQLYSLNYDLLLYWVQLAATDNFKDGFGLGDERHGFRGPFKEDAYCNVYNLHGGLHLFQTTEGDIEKRLMGANGVIDAIAATITNEQRLPVYVAEGTTKAKMAKINSVPYLRYCYDMLSASQGVAFIYGHSADENDEHIYRALFQASLDHIYFCIHQPTADVNHVNGELARYKGRYASQTDFTFVDSESASVWAE